MIKHRTLFYKSNLSIVFINSYLFVFLQPGNSRFGRTLRNAGVRRALSYSVDGNAELGMDAYDESEESDVPPKLIVLSDTEDEDTEGEDNGGSTRANAGVHRVVRYSAEGNAAVPLNLYFYVFMILIVCLFSCRSENCAIDVEKAIKNAPWHVICTCKTQKFLSGISAVTVSALKRAKRRYRSTSQRAAISMPIQRCPIHCH